MARVISHALALILGICGAGVSVSACSDPQAAVVSAPGTLRLALGATGASGHKYRLRNGVFDIAGKAELSVDTESDPDADSIDLDLEAGNYTITLGGSWYLERLRDDGSYESIDATLLSSATLPFAITAHETTNVRYRFKVLGDVVDLGGALSISIDVDDSCLPEGGSVCPGACEYPPRPSLLGDTPLFGASVALSDGTAVIGAPDDQVNAGAAYVFVKRDESWTHQAKLLPPASEPAWNFGMSVAMDRDTALVSAKVDPQGERRGIFVFTRRGQDWAWQATLSDDSVNSQDVRDPIALDGDTAVVGLWAGDDIPGAAYVFARSGAEWTQQAKVISPDSRPGDWFGTTVAVSGDTMLVGAWDVGAYVFRRRGSNWTFQTKLEVPQPGLSEWQVALSGNTAVIGAPRESVGGNDYQGAVYVFERAGAAWSRTKLMACDGAANDLFGHWLAVRGNRVAAVSYLPYALNGGVVHVFERSAAGWSQLARLVPTDSGQPSYGFPVALSADTVLLAGTAQAYLFSGQ